MVGGKEMSIRRGIIEKIIDGDTERHKNVFDVLRGYGKDNEVSKFVNDMNNGVTPNVLSNSDGDYSVCAIKTEDKNIWVIEIDVYGDYSVFVYNTR